MEWVWALVTAVITCAATTVVGCIFKHLIEKKFTERDRQNNELSEFHEEKRKKEITEIVSNVIKPVADQVSNIEAGLHKLEKSTKDSLKNDILTIYYRCVEKGYRNDYDYMNIHALYEDYGELHGNSFVEDIMKRFDKIPFKEEIKEVSISKSRAARKTLVESENIKAE